MAPLHQHEIGPGLVEAAVKRRHLADMRRKPLHEVHLMASGGVITVSEGSILAADAVLPDSASGRAANNGASASHRRVGQNSWSAVKAMERYFFQANNCQSPILS
jgi:hypothetical protein